MDTLTRSGLLDKAARLRWTADHTAAPALAKAARKEAEIAEARAAGWAMNSESAHDFDEKPLRHSHLHDHPTGRDTASASYFTRHAHGHAHALSAVEHHEADAHEHPHVEDEPAGDLYQQPLTLGQPAGLPRLIARAAQEKSAAPDLARRYRRLADTVEDAQLARGYRSLADQLLEEH